MRVCLIATNYIDFSFLSSFCVRWVTSLKKECMKQFACSALLLSLKCREVFRILIKIRTPLPFPQANIVFLQWLFPVYPGGFGPATFSPYGYYDCNLLNPVELMPLGRGPSSSGVADPNLTPGCGAAGPVRPSASTPANYTDLTELQPAGQPDYVLYADRPSGIPTCLPCPNLLAPHSRSTRGDTN